MSFDDNSSDYYDSPTNQRDEGNQFVFNNLDRITEDKKAQNLSQASKAAVIAAKSILASGGSEKIARKTAKAAAKSTLLQQQQADDNNSTRSGLSIASFSNKITRNRKVKKQASVVASLALVSASNSINNNSSEFDIMPDTSENRGSYRRCLSPVSEGSYSMAASDNVSPRVGASRSSMLDSAGSMEGNTNDFTPREKMKKGTSARRHSSHRNRYHDSTEEDDDAEDSYNSGKKKHGGKSSNRKIHENRDDGIHENRDEEDEDRTTQSDDNNGKVCGALSPVRSGDSGNTNSTSTTGEQPEKEDQDDQELDTMVDSFICCWSCDGCGGGEKDDHDHGDQDTVVSNRRRRKKVSRRRSRRKQGKEEGNDGCDSNSSRRCEIVLQSRRYKKKKAAENDDSSVASDELKDSMKKQYEQRVEREFGGGHGNEEAEYETESLNKKNGRSFRKFRSWRGGRNKSKHQEDAPYNNETTVIGTTVIDSDVE